MFTNCHTAFHEEVAGDTDHGDVDGEVAIGLDFRGAGKGPDHIGMVLAGPVEEGDVHRVDEEQAARFHPADVAGPYEKEHHSLTPEEPQAIPPDQFAVVLGESLLQLPQGGDAHQARNDEGIVDGGAGHGRQSREEALDLSQCEQEEGSGEELRERARNGIDGGAPHALAPSPSDDLRAPGDGFTRAPDEITRKEDAGEDKHVCKLTTRWSILFGTCLAFCPSFCSWLKRLR